MSQTTVTDEPQAFFEGLCVSKRHAHSVIASGQCLVGKAVGGAVADTDMFGDPLTTGAQEGQAIDASNPNFLGISMYSAQVEVPDGATYLAYQDEDPLPILRHGAIWVFVAAAVTDLSADVYARNASEGALPDAALGTFRPGTASNHVDLSAYCRFLAAGTIGARNVALIEVNI